MKFLPLVWHNLWRRKVRTTFTLLSIFIAFLLFGLLMTIRETFSLGVDLAGLDRLMVIHKISIIMPLPISYQTQLKTVPGVQTVTHNTWFGGYYQDSTNFFSTIATEPEPYFGMYPEIHLPPEQMKTWLGDRQGAVVGVDLAKRFGWKVGDRVPIQGTIFRTKSGSATWDFNIVGIFDGDPGIDKTGFFFRYDYLDENRQPNTGAGTVGWYVVKIKDSSQSKQLASTFDDMFANSSFETKTTTEKGFIDGFAKQIGDIGSIMIAILVAVLFTILLVVGNTMAQAVRERTSELAVLKTLGFSNIGILTLVLAESMFVAAAGGGLGLAVAWAIVARGDPTGGLLSPFVLPQRDVIAGIALIAAVGVAVVGIAGVVIVFVAVLSMAQGFYAAMSSAGAPDRALVMRGGATDEMTSGLGGLETDIIKQAPGLRHDGSRAFAAAELFVLVDLPKKTTGTPANVPMRGIDSTTLDVRNEAKIVEGRMLRFGTNEVIAGRAAMRQFAGLSVGSEIKAGQTTWVVVGAFESRGSVAETELWCDARFLQGAYRRGNSYQSVRVRLESPQSYTQFKDWLTSNPQLNVSVRPEVEYYLTQSITLTRLIRSVGFGIAALMGIGAVFGAILTMYTAVSTRTREIATLRALGFNTSSVLISVLAESFGLAALGGALGGLVAYVAFNGYQTSTMNFQTFSQVAFAFAVTPRLLGQGLAYALVMGLIGGLLPAVRAARLPIASALREL